MLGRILDNAPINNFLSFTIVTMKTVGQDVLPYNSCQNMNSRKMVIRCILHRSGYVCAKNDSSIKTVTRNIGVGGKVENYNRLP